MEIAVYKKEFLAHLEENIKIVEPQNLYNPIQYILELGGKRMRPILVLMGAEVFGGDYKKALDAALAVEVFHNFTLLHDDIMDAAPVRRSKPTVHEKWDVNTAILSGDAMMILAYQFLEEYEGGLYKELMKLFTKTALEVCEGQQYDMDFETLETVQVEKYIEMIKLKTSVLVAAALKMGAMIGGAKENEAQKLYEFGLNLGIAFQLQDDYLDVYGNPETFGKQVGGDIIENKKTYLYIQALKKSEATDKKKLLGLYATVLEDSSEKISIVKDVFKKYEIDNLTKKEIESYTKKAFTVLEEINLPIAQKQALKAFGEGLMVREV